MTETTEWTRVAHLTHRLPCPGGWLYKVEHIYGCTLQVVPDPDAPHVSGGTLDLVGVRHRLTQETDLEGGIRPWAEARGIHPSIIDHFLRGQRGPSPQLLEGLGLRKIIKYQIEPVAKERTESSPCSLRVEELNA